MPLYAMDSQKVMQAEYWTNRYIINAASLAEATTKAQQIRNIEVSVHSALVTFDKYRVSDRQVNTDIYQVVQDNVQGSRSTQGGEFLPLFCVIRCDFNTVGGGRPSRKYLRIPIGEGEQANGILLPQVVIYFNDNFVGPMLLIPNFVDVDNQPFGSGSTSPKVGMRQLRRGSKRRLLPVI